ncbi:MAG: hypothetical protein HY961_12775 [Ignavibacteriae bacterium]|nr:hypothetical protein [Ignavibacteriota bacterium]
MALLFGGLSIFFLLRNDYIVATIAAAVASLVVWQAALLLPVLMLDASINSQDPIQARRLVATIALVFGSAVLPWVLFAVYAGSALIPNELVASEIDLLSLPVLFEVVLFVGLMFVAVVLMASRHRMVLRTQSPLILWIVIASFAHRQMLVVTLPLVIVYAFFAVHAIIELFGKKNLAYIGVLLFTALSLAYNQFVVWPSTRRIMDSAVIVTEEIQRVASWARMNMEGQEKLYAPSGHEGLIQFYSERELGGADAIVHITNAADVNGYRVVFDPLANETQSTSTSSQHYRVWRKQ